MPSVARRVSRGIPPAETDKSATPKPQHETVNDESEAIPRLKEEKNKDRKKETSQEQLTEKQNRGTELRLRNLNKETINPNAK